MAILKRVLGRWFDRAAPIAIGVAALALLTSVSLRYPITDWLFFKYAKVWLWVFAWTASSVSAGDFFVSRLLPKLPSGERLLYAMTTGVFVHFLFVLLGGFAGFLTPAFAVLVPIGMFALGAKGLVAWFRQARNGHSRIAASTTKVTRYIEMAILFAGVCGILLVYFQILSPRNASFDSRMYHLGLAEGWVAAGEMSATVEGWFVDALPQLAAVLYTWALLVPFLDFFEHIELAAHIEFVLFLWTLFGVALCCKWLIPNGRSWRLGWVAVFLFPSLFVYDANLNIGSDHPAAFFGPAILHTLVRCFDLDRRAVCFLAFFLGCAVLTKYQSFQLALGPLLVIGVVVGGRVFRMRSAGAGAKSRLRRDLMTLAFATLVGLATTAPHWLKNWIWYGDPLYPLLHRHLTLHPWNEDAARFMNVAWTQLLSRPEGSLGEQLWETTLGFYQYAFRTFAREVMHGTVPVFGALFALCVIWLPFLRNTRRVWFVVVITNVGVFVWYFLSHVERYLQLMIPWMAAGVAASIVLAWRHSAIDKWAIGFLVALQLVWGGDAYFFRTHRMNNSKSSADLSAELFATGVKKGKSPLRTSFFGDRQSIGEALPDDAVLLLHENNDRTGLGATVVNDMAVRQGLINYGGLKSARAVFDLYTSMRITHIMWKPGYARGIDTRASDLRFFDFVNNYVDEKRRFGAWFIGTMPKAPPPARDENGEELVIFDGCSKIFLPGLFAISTLHEHAGRKIAPLERLSLDAEARQKQVERATFLISDGSCSENQLTSDIFLNFTKLAMRKNEALWQAKGRAP